MRSPDERALVASQDTPSCRSSGPPHRTPTKKATPAVVAGVALFFGCAEVRLTVLLCAGLRTLHRKLTCRNRSSQAVVRATAALLASTAGFAATAAAPVATRTCRGGYRRDRSSSSDGGSRARIAAARLATAALFRNRSSFRSHSFVRSRSSSRNRKKVRSSSSSGSTRTCHGGDRTDRSSSSDVGSSSCCSKNSRSHSFAHNRSSSQHLLTTTALFTSTALFAATAATTAAAAKTEEGIRASGRAEHQGDGKRRKGKTSVHRGTPKTRGGENRRVVLRAPEG